MARLAPLLGALGALGSGSSLTSGPAYPTSGPACPTSGSGYLTSGPGQRGVVPAWALRSSAELLGEAGELAAVSRAGFDASAWLRVNASRCSVMGCLLAAGVYADADLWFSDALAGVDTDRFRVPWVYRAAFALEPRPGQHFLLETNGITARADVFLNGRRVAGPGRQAGSFGGHTYDVTGLVAADNGLAVRAYPGDFRYDLIQGFVDWNPPAPDNGTGVWRDVAVRQTGPVAMGPLSVSVDLPVEDGGPARVTVRAEARNLEARRVRLVAESAVADPGGRTLRRTATAELGPGEARPIEVAHAVAAPELWWPRQWGRQPLYTARLTLRAGAELSDAAERRFGIRSVTSRVNGHNDTVFAVNGHPFQVLGAGYAPDHFLRWDRERFATLARYALDMGLNTLRLEGVLEQPELYDVADEMGLMVMAGWVCCSKWEAWPHNGEQDPSAAWTDDDYEAARAAMAHEAAVMQTHPSVMAFLVGSDSWPDDRATAAYAGALRAAHWQTPVVGSAAKRGFPARLGPSGLKMDGPYDWVPPNYWYDPAARLGAAAGFGSELGAGVGTPERRSLARFLTPADLDDLWGAPGDKPLYHMSTRGSPFANRRVYNAGLVRRLGPPADLDDYLLKAQMMDYEATRAQHEAYAARWGAERPATGSIYWMLNGAWPSLHWQLVDRYLHAAGAYFGTKAAAGRPEHVAFDYEDASVWLINRSLGRRGRRSIAAELIGLDGGLLARQALSVASEPNAAARAGAVSGARRIRDVALLRLVLRDEATGETLSRGVYWLARDADALDWANSTWWHTPVTRFADLTALGRLEPATVALTPDAAGLELENRSPVPAVFVRLELVDERGHYVDPVLWSDNYVTLWPRERLRLGLGRGGRVVVKGLNVAYQEVVLFDKRPDA